MDEENNQIAHFTWYQTASRRILAELRIRHRHPNLDRRFGLRSRRYRSKTSRLEKSLYQILQILSVTLFEKEAILQVFEAADSRTELLANPNQLVLFDI